MFQSLGTPQTLNMVFTQSWKNSSIFMKHLFVDKCKHTGENNNKTEENEGGVARHFINFILF